MGLFGMVLGQVNLHKIPEWVMPTAQAGLAARCDAKPCIPSTIKHVSQCENSESYIWITFTRILQEKLVSTIRGPKFSEDRDVIDAKFQKCENLSPLS